jgi:transcriptional regulator GlxA family with amidase domain
MLVQIALFDDFDLLDALAPYEVLFAGGVAAGGALRIELAAEDGPREVRSGPTGLPIAAAAPLDPDRADIIVVPGGAAPAMDAIPAILQRVVESKFPALLERAMARPRATVATVCGGSLILGMAGLLKGRRAVTHHLGMEVLAATGAVVVPARVVDDGNVVSAGGVTSGLDLAFHLLERTLGPQIAHTVELAFQYERRGTVWRPTGHAPVAAHVIRTV